MSKKQSLIVPLQIQAMCIGIEESAQKSAWFASPTAEYKRDIDGLATATYIKEPFETDSQISEDLQGIHLHWFLPDALTQMQQVEDEQGEVSQIFPAAPNRWLLTRNFRKNEDEKDSTCVSRSWIIESDFVSTQSKYQNSATVPWLNDEIPWRYLGRAITLETWSGEDTQAERFERLTAIGHGDPSFSLYYPNCRNVFGFHDDLEDLDDYYAETGQLSYSVIGWYVDEQEDPLSQAQKAGELKECLDEFNWLVEKGSNIEQISKILCCGMLQDVNWDRDREYISREINKNEIVTVGIGNRVTDGLSALLAGMAGAENSEIKSQQQQENLLDTMQVNHLDQLEKVDAIHDLETSLHKNTFSAETGGILWGISAKDPETNQQEKILSRELLVQLDELNNKQTLFNKLMFEQESIKQQTFFDWYKYMYYRHDSYTRKDLEEMQINDALFQQFLEPDSDPDGELKSLDIQIKGLAGKLQQGIGKHLVLNFDRVASRFFKPDDPVILLAGESMRSTLPHSTDSQLPCMLEQKLLAPFTSDKSNVYKNLPGCVGQLMSDLLIADPSRNTKTFEENSVGEKFMQLITGNLWNVPWNPLFMHWTIDYQELKNVDDQDVPVHFPEDVISSRFTLSEQRTDLVERHSKLTRSAKYEGITILNPNAVESFTKLAKLYARKLVKNEAISQALQKVDATPVLSQTLSGFHDALMMKSGEMLFPFDDPDADEIVTKLHQRINAFVGEFNRYKPTPNKFFNPLRAGKMEIDRIRVVDTFGQYRDIRPQTVYASKSLRLKKSDQTGLKKDSKPEIFLPPRLVQESRILFRWIPGESQSMETNDYTASSPVCGWIAPNFINQSLLVYDAEGTPLGELHSWLHGSTVFQSSPGKSPEFTIRFDDALSVSENMAIAIPENTVLRNYVASLIRLDEVSMTQFMKTLDEGLSDVEPEKEQTATTQSLLVGRPVAIVRVHLQLELKGLPAINQSWGSLAGDILNKKGNKSREYSNFNNIKFPVRLGNSKLNNEYNDGLLGYYRIAAGGKDFNYNALYSYQADGSNQYIIDPHDSSLELAANGSAETLLVLMDPAGRLNVSSGILPKKSIEIPAVHYQDFMNSLEVSFLAAPVLHQPNTDLQNSEDEIAIPVNEKADVDWSWLVKEKTGWRNKKLSPESPEKLSPFPMIISEGWLRLKTKQQNDDEN